MRIHPYDRIVELYFSITGAIDVNRAFAELAARGALFPSHLLCRAERTDILTMMCFAE